jgi:hypothetical protein
MKTANVKLSLLTVLGMVAANAASAATISWTNTSGGSWSVAANWSPNSVPGTSDDVFITSNGTYTVIMNVSPTISRLTLGGISGQQTLTNTSQTLTLSLPSVVNTNGILGMNAGVLSGLGSLSINGQVHWNGGSSGVGFSVTVLSSAVLNIESTITLSGVFTNLGTVNWLAGNVNIYTNAPGGYTGEIWNQAGALFDIQRNQTVVAGISPANFHNAGLVRKSAGSGTTAITVKLDNTGTVQAQTGVIGIQGPYTESPAATLAISLSALAPGTGFGKIQFIAKPTFAGTFTLGTLNSYRPNPGDSFFVISYPSATGDFTNFNGLDLGSGLRLAPRFSASGLTLVAGSYAVNPVPSLTLDRSVSGFLVAWPVNFTGWQLQSATNLPALSWTTVPVTGSNNIVLPFAVPQQYFRLFQ